MARHADDGPHGGTSITAAMGAGRGAAHDVYPMPGWDPVRTL